MNSDNGFLRRLYTLTYKEFLQLSRDNSSLLLGIILPFVLIIIMGYGMSLDVKYVPTAVVLEDSSPTVRDMVSFTRGSEYFTPYYVHSMREAESMLRSHEVNAIIQVPNDFTSQMAQGTGKVQVILNGGDATTAASAGSYIEAGILSWVTQQGVSSALGSTGQAAVISRIWFNDANTSTWFFVPGILMLVLTLVGVLLTAVVMAREWEQGTFESLFVTPVRIVELILSKMIPYFIVAMLGMILCLVVSRILYDLPMRGSLIVLMAVSILYLIVALSIGLLISALTKNQFLAAQLSLLISFLPSVMLSGFLFDLHSVPVGVQFVSKLFPTTYYLQLLKSLLLTGNYWPLIIKNSLILLGYAFVFLGLVFKIMRKKVE